MSNAHAARAPSSAARRVQCPASLLMSVLYPDDTESEAAREGTAAHHVAADMVTDSLTAARKPATFYVGTAAPNGVQITDEIFQGATVFGDYAQRLMRWTGQFSTKFMGIEQRVSAPSIHPAVFGTPDFWLFSPEKLTLWVADFKFGHTGVEAFENWQLIYYAAGVLDHLFSTVLEGSWLRRDDIEIRLAIVQPRHWHPQGPIREWPLRADQLAGYVEKAREAEARASAVDPRYQTGPECLYCPGASRCTALHRAAMMAADYLGTPAPHDPTPDAVGYELHIVHRAEANLKARKIALEAQVEAIRAAGGSVPGWSSEPTWSRRNWCVPETHIATVGEMFSVELFSRQPCTPAQAIAKGLPEDFIKSISETHKTGYKLVGTKKTLAHQVFSRSKSE